jgi:plasmid stabilization system protein ParE
MSYRLIIRPEAGLDIQDAFLWYETQRQGLDSEFVRSVDSCLSKIGRHPLSCPIIYKQSRRALIQRFPYGLIYVYDQNIISVVACFHGKRNPKQWRDRI